DLDDRIWPVGRALRVRGNLRDEQASASNLPGRVAMSPPGEAPGDDPGDNDPTGVRPDAAQPAKPRSSVHAAVPTPARAAAPAAAPPAARPPTKPRSSVHAAVLTGVKDAAAPVMHFLDMVG